MRRLIVCLLVMACFGWESVAETRIAEALRFRLTSGTVVTPAGGFATVPFDLKRGDRLELTVQLSDSVSGIGAFVCLASELEKLNNGLQTDTCRGFAKEDQGGAFEYEVFRNGSYVLMIDNSFANFFKKTVAYDIVLTTRTPQAETEILKKGLDDTYALLKTGFVFQDFDLAVAPCGQMNAFSETKGGHVTFCSELLFEANRTVSVEALMGILFHELGHTLLNLWGEPNFQNEQTADEFATVLMILAGQDSAAEKYVEFFSGKNAEAEALIADLQDSPHPLSIQRMRNIGHIIDAPNDYVGRWLPVLYRNMTVEALNSEIQSPTKFSDVNLAKRTLKSKTP